jgi:hypothetical protein
MRRSPGAALAEGTAGGKGRRKGNRVNIDHAIVERLLDALYTSGREQVWEILVAELSQLLHDVAMERRYWVGIEWLDEIDRLLRDAGVQLPSMRFLQVLIRAGGDELDQTMLLPTGIQNLHAN